MEDPRANSVRNLENLYSVVVGLGLSMAIMNIVEASRAPIPIKLALLPLFLSYLVTLIPFYHGALRHLDVTYIERSGHQVRAGALLADFLILFVESCFLVALALLLPSPQLYSWGLALLLLTDTTWGFLAHLAFSQDSQAKAELRWAIINGLTVAILCLLLIVIGPFPPTSEPMDLRLSLAVFIVSFARSCTDYGLNWHFYYPSPAVHHSHKTPDAASTRS